MGIERTIIATEQAPAAIGPYSQAITAAGLVFWAVVTSWHAPLVSPLGDLLRG